MSTYHEDRPKHGKAKIPTGPRPAVPEHVDEPDTSPIPDVPRNSETQDLDRDAILEYLWKREQETKKAEDRDGKTRDTFLGIELAKVDEYEQRIARAQRWGGWIWGLVGVIGVVFSAGVAYSVFMGANATDAEVEDEIQKATVEHNGGIDPEATDPATHEPVGHHPDLREAIEENTAKVDVVKAKVESVESSAKKLDKRSEYQFELGKWQADSLEAERAGRRPPKKPRKLEALESDLMLGKYD